MIYKKYSELDAWIPTLGAGEYELTVDCSGVAPSEFTGSKTSPFGLKLVRAPKGVTFKLWCTNVGSDVTSLRHMLYRPGRLGPPVSFFSSKGFEHVTDTSGMFQSNVELKSIDCSAFTQVTNASAMFSRCLGLTEIDTSAFTQVTNANSMFSGCIGLTEIDTSVFTQVTNANSMFYDCRELTEIDTSVFTQVTNASLMFSGCSGLTSIDTSAFTQVTNASWMFKGCSGLTSIDTKAFTQVTDANSMFDGCKGLTSITFGTKALTGTYTYLNAPITTARVRGPNAQTVKDTIVNEAATNKWPTSATWTVEQTKEWKFVRVK